MKNFRKEKGVLKSNKNKYFKVYKRIKNRCQFQKYFSGFLLAVFFILQYSVPISLVVLGSIASSREQLSVFFSTETEALTNSDAVTPTSEMMVSRIIYLVGLISILLGVINNIVRPAESYDTAANFNNQFFRFEHDFDLQFFAISHCLNELVDDEDIVKFLMKKNDELCQLIEEYNNARSLSPRQHHSQVLNQSRSQDNLKSAYTASDDLISGQVSTSNSLLSSPNQTEHELEQQQLNNCADEVKNTI